MLLVSKTLRAALEPKLEGKQVTLTTVGKPGTSPQVIFASGTAVLMPAIAAHPGPNHESTA